MWIFKLFLRVGGWVLKMKSMLSQLSTKLYFEVEADLGNIFVLSNLPEYDYWTRLGLQCQTPLKSYPLILDPWPLTLDPWPCLSHDNIITTSPILTFCASPLFSSAALLSQLSHEQPADLYLLPSTSLSSHWLCSQQMEIESVLIKGWRQEGQEMVIYFVISKWLK